MSRVFPIQSMVDAGKAFTYISSVWSAAWEAGKPIEVEVRPIGTKRSSEANRRYFGDVLKTISEQAWIEGRQYSTEVWHGYFAGRILGYIDLPGGGRMPEQTSILPRAEFSAYTDQV